MGGGLRERRGDMGSLDARPGPSSGPAPSLRGPDMGKSSSSSSSSAGAHGAEGEVGRKCAAAGAVPGAPRWFTLEFLFYYAYAAVFFSLFISASVSVSSRFASNPLLRPWLPGLHPGWLGGRRVDLTDPQWRSFRANLPLLFSGMMALCCLSRWGLPALHRVRRWPSLSAITLVFWATVSLAYVAYLHGWALLLVGASAALNFLLTRQLAGTRHFLPLLWAYHCGLFLLIRSTDGIPFATLGPVVGPAWAPWLSWLDAHRGVFRWHICYNLLMLRMLSFACDVHWARLAHGGRRGEAQLGAVSEQGSYAPLEGWLTLAPSPLVYTAYLFFAPLYLAGPIIRFQTFAAQLQALDSPPGTPPARPEAARPLALLLYGARTLLVLLLLEASLHFAYFPALAHSRLWRDMSTAELCALSYGTLNFVWLKFTAIWRLARFWALVAGVDPPENILRCVSNNYTVQGFWRGWHASFNRWIVRYMYVPLGGSAWKAVNVWPIFTFVALWHDLEWRMLAWAWLMSLLILPELLISWAAKRSPLAGMEGRAVYREAAALLGAVNILGLMLANLVGFVVGPAGASDILARLAQPEARPLLLYLYFSLYVGVKLMLEIREAERRQKLRGKGLVPREPGLHAA